MQDLFDILRSDRVVNAYHQADKLSGQFLDGDISELKFSVELWLILRDFPDPFVSGWIMHPIPDEFLSDEVMSEWDEWQNNPKLLEQAARKLGPSPGQLALL